MSQKTKISDFFLKVRRSSGTKPKPNDVIIDHDMGDSGENQNRNLYEDSEASCSEVTSVELQGPSVSSPRVEDVTVVSSSCFSGSTSSRSAPLDLNMNYPSQPYLHAYKKNQSLALETER